MHQNAQDQHAILTNADFCVDFGPKFEVKHISQTKSEEVGLLFSMSTPTRAKGFILKTKIRLNLSLF